MRCACLPGCPKGPASRIPQLGEIFSQALEFGKLDTFFASHSRSNEASVTNYLENLARENSPERFHPAPSVFVSGRCAKVRIHGHKMLLLWPLVTGKILLETLSRDLGNSKVVSLFILKKAFLARKWQAFKALTYLAKISILQRVR